MMGVKRDVTGAIIGECLGGIETRGGGRSYKCSLPEGSMFSKETQGNKDTPMYLVVTAT